MTGSAGIASGGLLVRRQSTAAAKSAPGPKDMEESTGVSAVIAESRNLSYLPMVLMNMHKWLPDIRIQLFHAKNNQYFVENQADMRALREQGVLTLTRLPAKYYDQAYNWTGYQTLMESAAFWEATLPSRKVLAFQADSWVCRGAEELLGPNGPLALWSLYPFVLWRVDPLTP